MEYLRFHRRLQPGVKGRRYVVGRWTRMLNSIQDCAVCCSSSHRERARSLLARYHERGAGSDAAIGRNWIAELADQRSTSSSGTSAAPAAITINNGNAIYGQVQNADVHNNTARHRSRSASPEEETYSGDDIDDAGNTPPPPHVSITEQRDQAYTAMLPARMWHLRSGRTVEKVLFDNTTMEDSFEMAVGRSYTIDVTRPVMKAWFEEDEWKEIIESVRPLPASDAVLLDSFNRFDKVRTAERLRTVLETTGYRDKDTAYDRSVHFHAEWADIVLRNMLLLYEDEDCPLSNVNNAEDWYPVRLWSHIIDNCFLNMVKVNVQRKELSCRATVERRNRTRSATGPGHRAKIGPKLDGIILGEHGYEYGGMEVAKVYTGSTSSKFLDDVRKLCKALRDMLRRLHECVNNDTNITPRLQVVGFITQGLRLQVLRMHRGAGYVCLLQREELHQVPADIHQLWKLILLVNHVARVKAVVQECVDAVRSPPTQSLREALLGNAGREEETPLGWSSDSP